MMNAHLSHALGHEMSDAHRLIMRESRRKGDQAAALDARGHIARSAQASRHDMRYAANGRIAGCPPKGGVVKIQCIDIHREHGDAALLAMRHGPVALQQLFEIWQCE